VCGILKVLEGFPKFAMEFLGDDEMNNQPFHFANFDFSFIGSLIPGCPRCFINHRMRLCEWMAWILSAHDHTPFIKNGWVTW
jgi:hypothetical protein